MPARPDGRSQSYPRPGGGRKLGHLSTIDIEYQKGKGKKPKKQTIGVVHEMEKDELTQMLSHMFSVQGDQIVGLQSKDKKDTSIVPLSYVVKYPGNLQKDRWNLVMKATKAKKEPEGDGWLWVIWQVVFTYGPWIFGFYLSWRILAWLYQSNVTPEQIGTWFADTFMRPTLKNIYKNGPAFEILNVSLGFWAGKDVFQICSEMHPGTESSFWSSDKHNVDKCKEIYRKKEQGFVSIVEGFFYLYIVFNVCQFFWKTFTKLVWKPLGGGGDDDD